MFSISAMPDWLDYSISRLSRVLRSSQLRSFRKLGPAHAHEFLYFCWSPTRIVFDFIGTAWPVLCSMKHESFPWGPAICPTGSSQPWDPFPSHFLTNLQDEEKKTNLSENKTFFIKTICHPISSSRLRISFPGRFLLFTRWHSLRAFLFDFQFQPIILIHQ